MGDSHLPRTPNGTVDLLSGDTGDGFPVPSNLVLSEDYDDEDVVSPTPWTRSSDTDVTDEEEDDDDDDDDDDDAPNGKSCNDVDIYSQFESFSERMDSELLDLENFGVSTGSSSSGDEAEGRESRGQDPDGRGERSTPPTSPEAASAAQGFERGGGKSTKNLAALTGKTTKIMSDYQAYLSEITEDFPLTDEDDVDEDEEAGPALASVHRARDDVRDAYAEQLRAEEEGGRGPRAPVAPPPSPTAAERDENYATGGGEPLYRAWSRASNPGYSVASVFGDSVASVFGERDGPRGHYVPAWGHCFPSWRRSRRVNSGIIALIALAIAVVVIPTAIISSNRKASDLPEWEVEYNAEIEMSHQERGPPDWKAEHIAKIEKEGKRGDQRLFFGGDDAAQLTPKRVSSLPDRLAEYTVQIELDEGPVLPNWKAGDMDKIKTEEERGDDTDIRIQHTPKDAASPPPSPNREGNEDKNWDFYYVAAQKYHPVIYDRNNGWKGQTYVDALVFCEEAAGLAVCPYEAVCPDPGGEPLGKYRYAPEGDWAWMPILDAHNEWVQVGSARESCVTYSDVHQGESPEWGMTGEGNEDITQNVMCCLGM